LTEVDVSSPGIPVINNVDVEAVDQPQNIRDALARQACHPVRWVEVIQRMAHMGITHIIECGPGRVLSALTGRIEPRLQSVSLADADALVQGLQLFERVA
jgi:[acyl-carrier-protein] S-malonyltransferase